MDFAIYTYGGGEVLWKVLNGIAILFQSESHYFTSIGKLTIGASLLLVALRAVPQASFPIFLKSWFLPTTLLVALFYGPKVQIHIIDEIDTSFHHAKVDNIPLGIAWVASFTSSLSKHLTEVTESKFATSDVERFSKVGPMFATQMIHHAQQLTIKDPLMRENMKDFVRQCYAWPYVFSNLAPGKKAAMEAEDILGFIESNPHPLLGIYWRYPDGHTEFQNCRQCTNKVREALKLEVDYGIKSLAEKLFPSSGNESNSSRRLLQYFGDAWGSIAKGASNAARTIQQELLINSYREALQDKRDELGLGRTDMSLLQLNAARGQAYQNNSFLAKAALAGGQITTLHGLFFALSLIFFALVAPLTFLPQGLRLLLTWLKCMAWLATWPVILTVLNLLGHMYAAKSISSELVGLSSGLTLLTQSGMAEASYNAYCWIMGLQLSVPFLSWALISGGGYAFSQMASSLTQSSEGFASKVGSELVDGNISFDTQSIGNRSLANFQIAQQQLSPAFNTATRFDDGKLSFIHGPNGQVTIQEHLTQLGTNITESNAVNQMMAIQSQFSKAAANQERVSLQNSISTATNEAVSSIKSFATSVGSTESFGDTVTTQVSKQAQELLGLAEKVGQQNQLSTDVVLKALLGANVSSKFKGSGLGIDGSLSTGSADTDIWQKVKDTDLGKQFSQNWQKLNQYVYDNRGSISHSSGLQHLDNMQISYNEAQTHSKNLDAHIQTSKTWSELASTTSSTGITATTNANEKYLQEKANAQFGGNILLAAQTMVKNRETQNLGNTAINQAVSQSQSSQGAIQEIHDFYHQTHSTINTPPLKSSLDAQRQDYNIDAHSQSLNQRLDDVKDNSLANIRHNSGKIGDQKKYMELEHRDVEQNFDQNKDKTLLRKTVGKVADQVISLFSNSKGKNK